MKILICISNVPDTTTKIRFNAEKTALDASGIQWIINPWDELALTRALELKENAGGAVEKITVITVGASYTEATLRKALAIGADDAVRIDADPKDAYFVAAQLADFIKQNPYDIILCGIDSSDYNGSMVGGMLSEMVDMTSVSSVSALEINEGKVSVKREIDGGQETLEVGLPFTAIVQKGITKEPRIPSMRGIMMARTKPLTVKAAVSSENLTEFVSYELPAPKEKCKMIDAENLQDVVNVLHDEFKVL